jgi:23S rRNA (cytidine1920-2'-O)/16S rRNA (cytidine1409-2'-O)-methyltransferase
VDERENVAGSKTIKKKERIDKLLVRKGLVDSREQAQTLIDQGLVLAGGQPITKSSTHVQANTVLEVKGERNLYASRGGLKLEAALDEFGIDPSHLVIMDVGSSTGGFTDCLLQRGAAKVFTVDVGYGQLAWRLRKDSRVVCMERTNIRYLDTRSIDCLVDLVTIDVSFISLKKVLPKVAEVLKLGGCVLALIKPQFEVGRGEVGRGGIVRSKILHERAVEEISSCGKSLGLVPLGHVASPLPGKKGNIEYFLYLKKEQSMVVSQESSKSS